MKCAETWRVFLYHKMGRFLGLEILKEKWFQGRNLMNFVQIPDDFCVDKSSEVLFFSGKKWFGRNHKFPFKDMLGREKKQQKQRFNDPSPTTVFFVKRILFNQKKLHNFAELANLGSCVACKEWWCLRRGAKSSEAVSGWRADADDGRCGWYLFFRINLRAYVQRVHPRK